VPVRFPAMTGRRVRVTITAIRAEQTLDYYSEAPIALPVAIAELGLPGVVDGRGAGPVPSACRADLLTVDGRPVPLRITGDRATAAALGPLAVSTCDGTPLLLGPGSHDVRSALGRTTGVDLDRLVLDAAPAAATTAAVGPTGATPTVTVRHQGRTTADVHISGAAGPFWLVLGQSLSPGWTAHVRGGPSLGKPTLVDGFANGWQVRPTQSSFDVHLDWTPQHKVRLALLVSALAALACVVLAIADRRQLPASPDERPVLALPLGPRPRPRWPWFLAGPVVVLAIVAPVAGLPIGALAAAAVLVALALPWARVLVATGAVGMVLAAGITTAVQQAHHHYPPEFEWPTFFRTAHRLGWLAVALLVADAMVEALRRRSSAS